MDIVGSRKSSFATGAGLIPESQSFDQAISDLQAKSQAFEISSTDLSPVSDVTSNGDTTSNSEQSVVTPELMSPMPVEAKTASLDLAALIPSKDTVNSKSESFDAKGSDINPQVLSSDLGSLVPNETPPVPLIPETADDLSATVKRADDVDCTVGPIRKLRSPYPDSESDQETSASEETNPSISTSSNTEGSYQINSPTDESPILDTTPHLLDNISEREDDSSLEQQADENTVRSPSVDSFTNIAEIPSSQIVDTPEMTLNTFEELNKVEHITSTRGDEIKIKELEVATELVQSVIKDASEIVMKDEENQAVDITKDVIENMNKDSNIHPGSDAAESNDLETNCEQNDVDTNDEQKIEVAKGIVKQVIKNAKDILVNEQLMLKQKEPNNEIQNHIEETQAANDATKQENQIQNISDSTEEKDVAETIVSEAFKDAKQTIEKDVQNGEKDMGNELVSQIFLSAQEQLNGNESEPPKVPENVNSSNLLSSRSEEVLQGVASSSVASTNNGASLLDELKEVDNGKLGAASENEENGTMTLINSMETSQADLVAGDNHSEMVAMTLETQIKTQTETKSQSDVSNIEIQNIETNDIPVATETISDNVRKTPENISSENIDKPLDKPVSNDFIEPEVAATVEHTVENIVNKTVELGVNEVPYKSESAVDNKASAVDIIQSAVDIENKSAETVKESASEQDARTILPSAITVSALTNSETNDSAPLEKVPLNSAHANIETQESAVTKIETPESAV
ncbi:unnamed protein product, partial [Owenia fusiformis]